MHRTRLSTGSTLPGKSSRLSCSLPCFVFCAATALVLMLVALLAATRGASQALEPATLTQITSVVPGDVSSIPFPQQLLVAKALDPEAVAHGLPADAFFDSTFKNPCWQKGADLRCMPHTYIMGSFQGGAEALYQMLAEHPDVVTNDKARWQFWGEDTKKMREYVDTHSSPHTISQLKQAPAQKIILDGSCSSFAFYWSAGLRAHRAFQSSLVPCWSTCSEEAKGNTTKRSQCMDTTCHPKCASIDLKVAEGLGVPYDALHNPIVMSAVYGPDKKRAPKLLVTVRDPINRLHTAYWQYPHYKGKYGSSAEGFEEYVTQQVGQLRTCTARFIGKPGGPQGGPMDRLQAERHCALYFEALGSEEEQVFFHADQIIRSMYSIFLEVWLRHFPRENLMVVKSEDFYKDPKATIEKVFGFLELSQPLDEKAMAKVMSFAREAHEGKDTPPLTPKAKTLLKELFRPYNADLAKLLSNPAFLEYNSA